MSRRILLVMPPNDSDLDNYNKPAWSLCRIPPIGLLSIASYLTKSGYHTIVDDCRHMISTFKFKYYLDGLKSIVEYDEPDVVGINMLTADYSQVKLIAEGIKRNYPSVKIILGGVHPSVEPDLTLKQIPEADAVCVGAGEEVMLEVAKGCSLDNIRGLKTRNNADTFIEREPELNIDKYPFPNYDFVNKDWYTQLSTYTITGWAFKGISALTSRGCPYSCNFCASNYSKPFRFHSADYVIELAEYLTKMDVDVVSFFDDTMALKEDRLIDICNGFIRKKLFYPQKIMECRFELVQTLVLLIKRIEKVNP